MRPFATIALMLLACAACAPGETNQAGGDGGNDPGDGGSGGPDAFVSDNATITGVVWAPGNAPGMVPTSHEIPVAGALVYATQTAPPEIPAGAYCEQCEEPPDYDTVADAKGNFSLSVPAGTYWLVMQKGQFRLTQQITVGLREALSLSAAQSTLPSEHDPANGKTTPRVAIATGSYDKVEAIFGKMGIGMVDATGAWVGSQANDNIDLFTNGGIGGLDSVDALLNDLERMKQYHLIVFPCTLPSASLFNNQTQRQNIRAYVAAGGKLYVADWAAEFADVPFPEYVVMNPDADNWDPGCTGGCMSANVFPQYSTTVAMSPDPQLAAWLTGQTGPGAHGGVDEVYDGAAFDAVDNYVKIATLPTIDEGVDDMGNPVMQQAKAWVMGSWSEGEGPIHPFTVTYEPKGGCGRVLFSTYHTAPAVHVGLVPQERVLMYLMMEIGVCKDTPVID